MGPEIAEGCGESGVMFPEGDSPESETHVSTGTVRLPPRKARKYEELGIPQGNSQGYVG